MSIDNSRIVNLSRGRMFFGFSSFAGTATTASIQCPFARIEGFDAFYIGTPASTDGPLSLSGVSVTNNWISRPSNGLLSVSRPAGTTSNLAFAYLIIGH